MPSHTQHFTHMVERLQDHPAELAILMRFDRRIRLALASLRFDTEVAPRYPYVLAFDVHLVIKDNEVLDENA